MPFTNAYHGPGAPEPEGLSARIQAELRSRIEDAVDYACLDAMVRARRTRGVPAPAADNPQDREEYLARVRVFLLGFRNALARDLTDHQRERLGGAVDLSASEPDVGALVTVHVAFAQELPDYWQRFETFRTHHAVLESPVSRRERRGLFDRFLGRR